VSGDQRGGQEGVLATFLPSPRGRRSARHYDWRTFGRGGRRWSATAVFTSRRGPGLRPPKGYQHPGRRPCYGPQTGDGFLPAAPIQRSPQKPPRGHKEPPIDDAGECRGTCEGAENSLRRFTFFRGEKVSAGALRESRAHNRSSATRRQTESARNGLGPGSAGASWVCRSKGEGHRNQGGLPATEQLACCHPDPFLLASLLLPTRYPERRRL
jgi:hypothetical protein